MMSQIPVSGWRGAAQMAVVAGFATLPPATAAAVIVSSEAKHASRAYRPCAALAVGCGLLWRVQGGGRGCKFVKIAVRLSRAWQSRRKSSFSFKQEWEILRAVFHRQATGLCRSTISAP